MSVADQSILDFNKIILLAAEQSAQPIATDSKELLSFLVSTANRTSVNNPINLRLAKEEMIRNSQGQKAKTIVIKTKPIFNPRKTVYNPADYGTNECDFAGQGSPEKINATLNVGDKIVAVERFQPQTCAPGETYESQLRDCFARLYEQFNHNANTYCVKQLALKQNGKFKYIGNSPSSNADISYAPGKRVNLFMADGLTPNRADVNRLQQEMTVAGIRTNQCYSFGDALWDSYAANIGGYNKGDQTGFDFSILRPPFLNQGFFMMNVDVATAFRQQGVEQPLLILKPGAVQLVTMASWEANLLTYDFGQHKRAVITVPGFGIKANFTVKIDTCPKDAPIWDFKLEADCALFTLPGCIASEISDDFLQDYNGVMLYSGGCGDSTFCDQPEFSRTIQDRSIPTQDCQVQETVCGTPTTCSVTISPFYNPDGTLVLTANAIPVPPSTITSYEWERNGNPVAGTTSQILLPQGGWVNGDVFTVAILTSNGCTATATFAADSLFPTLQLLRNGSAIASGAEVAVSSTVGAGNVTVTINMAALSSANVNVSSVLVTNDAGVPGATFTSPTTPFVLVEGTPQNIVLTVPRAVSGVITFAISVASDDPMTPNYEVGAKITIV